MIEFIIGIWIGTFIGALAVAQCNRWAAEAERQGYKEPVERWTQEELDAAEVAAKELKKNIWDEYHE